MRRVHLTTRTQIEDKVYGPNEEEGADAVVSDEVCAEIVSRRLGTDEGESEGGAAEVEVKDEKSEGGLSSNSGEEQNG